MASNKAHHATGFAAGVIAAAIVARSGAGGPFHLWVLSSFIAAVAGGTAPDWLLGVLDLSVLAIFFRIGGGAGEKTDARLWIVFSPIGPSMSRIRSKTKHPVCVSPSDFACDVK